MLRLLRENNVQWFTSTTLAEITDNGVLVVNKNGQKELLSVDSVVMATGMKPDDKLYLELESELEKVYKIR